MATREEHFIEADFFLEVVKRHAGEEGVRKVLIARGGTKVCVSTKATDSSWIVALLGSEAANRIIEDVRVADADGRFIKYLVHLPMRQYGRVSVTRKQVHQRLMRGDPVSRIALALGIHERTVWRYRAKLIADGIISKRSEENVAKQQRSLATSKEYHHEVAQLDDLCTSEDRMIAEEFGLPSHLISRLRARLRAARNAELPAQSSEGEA